MTIKSPAPRDIPALRDLWHQAFGDGDAFLDTFFSTAYSPDRCRCLFAGDRLAAALYWFDAEYRGKPAAYLYAIATAPAFQRQGFCHSLMADTHRHLTALGYGTAFLVPAGTALFPFYETLGYRSFGAAQKRLFSPQGTPEILTRIGPGEYACRRKTLLPPDGVVQEGATLAFLNALGELYAGEGFLFALCRESSGVFLTEFLGDPARLPAIAAALNTGPIAVRLPESSVPFSMALDLTGGRSLTGYLGLALD